jgi:hypothetical protein
MVNFFQECVDYVEGRADYCLFERMLQTNNELLEWLQGIVPEDKKMFVFDGTINDVVLVPYNVKVKLEECENIQVGGPKGSPEYRYVVHNEISNLISEAFPDRHFARDIGPEIDYDLCMDACPQYIGGVEIGHANIIGALLNSIPRTLSKANRKKQLKSKILEAFHIEGKQYPKWKQEPYWPVHNGQPMKFVRTVKINSEVSVHYFVDIESGFERSIEDSY